MRYVCYNIISTRYPRSTPGLIAQGSFRISGGGRLRVKVVVFEKPRQLQQFWKVAFGKADPLGRGCLGVCSDRTTLAYEVDKDGEVYNRRIICDRRHFCIVGLVREYCTMRILTHEATHAGFCHARRVKHSDWKELALAFDEEAVAYPAGEVARWLVNFLDARGLVETR